MKCRHCKVRKAYRPRGLCWGCYRSRAIRDLHPTCTKMRPDLIHGVPETEADLDRLIAERRKTLPAW